MEINSSSGNTDEVITTTSTISSSNDENNNNNNLTTTTTETATKKKRNRGVFHFKQYAIHQEHCGQKVGTDALIVAGYTSIAKFQPNPLDQTHIELDQKVWSNQPYDFALGKSNETVNKPTNNWPKYILDIGTGSGVLSIMLCQRFSTNGAIVNSIDIDKNAVKQATINIDEIYKKGDCNWIKNVFVFNTPIQEFQPHVTPTAPMEKNTDELLSIKSPADSKYDLIISAPPYFPTEVKVDKFVTSMDDSRRIARHTHTLTMDELVISVCRLLRPDTGIFTTVVSLPQPDDDLLVAAKQHGLQLLEDVDVTDCPGSKLVRKMYTFRLPSTNTTTDNQTIKQNFAIYETSMKESTLSNHRKHSNQYKWMLNDFCNHYHKEVDYEIQPPK